MQYSSMRSSYAGLDGGPVKMSSTNGLPIVASERVAYSPNGGATWTSYSELMGLPANQLTNSYTFPWYNNLDLNSQLRFGNVGTAPTTVTVTIGGVFQGNYTLAPNASQRVSYDGLDRGPVKVTSSGNVPIIASMRVAYFNGSNWTSFSEMMGLPSPKLTSSYVFPWYNNLDLNSQLRFGNVGSSHTTVTVTVGEASSRAITPWHPTRASASVTLVWTAGPVKVTSSGNVPIIASDAGGLSQRQCLDRFLRDDGHADWFPEHTLLFPHLQQCQSQYAIAFCKCGQCPYQRHSNHWRCSERQIQSGTQCQPAGQLCWFG